MKNRKKILALVSGLLCLSAVAVSFTAAVKANSTNSITSEELDETIKEVYKYNDLFIIPEISIEGVDNYSVSLVFPDGTAKNSQSLLLDQVGTYKLRYSFKKNNKVQTLEKTFSVKFGAYFFSGEGEIKSKAQYTTFTDYGEGQKYEHPLLTGPNPKYLQTDKTDCYPNTGLLVELAKGEKLTFSTPVSLDKFVGDAFIQLSAVPYSQLTADANRICVDLVDSEDPNIFVSIMAQKIDFNNAYKNFSGVNARGENQIYTGLEIKEPNAPNKWHKNDIWGSLAYHSFFSGIHINDKSGWPDYSGTFIEAPSSYGSLIFGYDNQTRTVFDCTDSPLTPKTLEEKKMTYVADLDSTEAFDELWNGFKSDRVYVSVYMDQYAGNTGRIMIPYYKFADLSKDFVEDGEKPNLVVNTTYTPTSMPKASIGKAYTIPTAEGYDDLCGKTKVDISVDYNYVSGHPVDVEVVNNKFVPLTAGTYRINYSTKDPFGNETKVSYFVETSDSIEPLDVTFEDKKNKVDLGDKFVYPTPIITGGSGDISYKVIVSNSTESFDITETGSILIDNYDSWKVKYVVSDFAGNEITKEYSLILSVTDRYFVYDDINFDQYLFNNLNVNLPEIYAYNYSTGKKKALLCDVDVEYNGQISTYKSGTSFVPSVTSNRDIVKIQYHVSNVNVADLIEREVIDLVSKNEATSQLELKLVNYFAGAEEYVNLTSKNVQFLNNTSETPINIGWTFVNKFLPTNNSVTINNIIENNIAKSNLTGFEFKFTDANYPEQCITAYVDVGVDSMIFTVGDDTYPVTFSLNTSFNNQFTVGYKSNSITFTQKSSASVLRMPILRYDNGQLFNGFQSNFITVSVTAKGIKNGNGYAISEIAGQNLSAYTTRDTTMPYTYTVGGISGSYKQHSIYTTNKCLGADVLSPNVKTTVSVLRPDNTYAKDVNGLELKGVSPDIAYSFELEQLGIYTVLVECVEDNWNWKNLNPDRKIITSVDVQAPTITLKGEIPTEVKVGDVVYIPGFVVSDDVSSADKIKVFITVIPPNAREVQVDMNGGFKAGLVGTYYLLITATDEAGNLGQLFFKISCIN